MADKNNPTLRSGDASPKNIILRALPAVAAASTVIFLFASAPSAKDIVLRDTTATPVTGSASVSPNNASHAHSATSPAINQAHVIAPASAVHAHSATSPSIFQSHQIVVANAAHGHTSTSPTVTSESASKHFQRLMMGVG